MKYLLGIKKSVNIQNERLPDLHCNAHLNVIIYDVLLGTV